jgi:hypothetical protein
MKLFFDLPGFIFVVGLDEQVIHQAVRAKFAASDARQAGIDGQLASPDAAMTEELGQDYAKKIFQVPYALPVTLPQQLNELLNAMYKQAKLEKEQQDDIHCNVRPYLRRVAVNERINPREVKRFINAYTLQTLVRLNLDPPVVLALQTIAFRFDWQDAYDAINADPDQFRSDLRAYLHEGDKNAFIGSLPGLEHMPAELRDYLASELAAPLTKADSLVPYLSSLQSVRGVTPWFADALGALGRFHRALATALSAPGEPESSGAVTGRWAELREATRDGGQLRDSIARDHLRKIEELIEEYRQNPARSVEVLRQMQDETVQLRSALRLARDSSYGQRSG